VEGFPFRTYPTGWFQVGWSAQLAPETMSSLKIFGRDVVLYRSRSGVARLVDAHCPHLGAHLGFGKVVGDCIQCPFHGWEFDLGGRNSLVPFADRPMPKIKLRQWDIEEKNGVIFVWHDALGREPFWSWIDVPELDDAVESYPAEQHYAGIRKILPQQMFENGPDELHFCYVHGSGEPAQIVSWKEEFPFLHYQAELKFGADKAPTWLTPNGPVVARLTSQATIGVGVVWFSFDDIKVTQLVAMTPVDAEHSMAFSTTAGKRDPSSPDKPNERTVGLMRYQHSQIERDFSIWENQIYIERPPFSAPEKRHFAKFRNWVSEYYPEEALENPYDETG